MNARFYVPYIDETTGCDYNSGCPAWQEIDAYNQWKLEILCSILNRFVHFVFTEYSAFDCVQTMRQSSLCVMSVSPFGCTHQKLTVQK